MKQKLLKTMKGLLVAVGLLIGVNAYADATVIYGRAMTADAENGYSAWSAADVAESGTDLNVWYGNFGYNETYGLYASANGARSAVMTFSHTSNSLQVFDIVFDNLGNTGNSGNYSYIKIGSDIEIQSNQQDQKGAVIINGTSYPITDCNVKNYNRGGDKWTIHIEVNTAKKTVKALTIVGEKKYYGNGFRSANYTLESETALSNSATYNTVTIGFTRAAGTPATALTSIRIAEEAQDVTNANYTINYKFGENIIKTEEGTSTVDAVINAELPFTKDGQKYYAAADATTSIKLIDGVNILNVNLRKANEYAYSINNNFGTSIASGKYIEGEEAIKVYWSKYVENEGEWYECDEASYGVSVSGVLDKTVSYTTPASISYFIECENMSVSRSAAASDTGTGYSGGKTIRHYSNSYWWTPALPGGIYSLSIPYKNQNSSDGTINIYLRDSEGNLKDTELSIVGGRQSSGTLSAEGITVPPGYSLVLNNTTGYNSNVLMDYIALTKTADFTVSKSISAAGWATYCSPYALDLGNATGLTDAYIVTGGTNGVLAKTSVKGGTVPANTGLLLKGSAGTVTIPVVASSETVVSSNILTGVTAATEIEAETGWVLMNDETNGLGFYQNESGFTVGANTAYIPVSVLPVPNNGSVRSFFSLDDDAAGISDVKSEKDAANGYYNLSGQRISKPSKGLFIVDGKKVVIR